MCNVGLAKGWTSGVSSILVVLAASRKANVLNGLVRIRCRSAVACRDEAAQAYGQKLCLCWYKHWTRAVQLPKFYSELGHDDRNLGFVGSTCKLVGGAAFVQGEVVKGMGMGGAVRPRGAGLPTGEQDGLHVTRCVPCFAVRVTV